MYCSNCGNKISDKAFVCPVCGAKVNNFNAPCETKAADKSNTGAVAAISPAANATTVIVNGNDGDSGLLFPVVSLLAYIIVYPIGFILNVVGLFFGKRKGCFFSLFIVFFIIPFFCGIIFVLLSMIVATAEK